jgi:hypothetical protein
VMPIMQSPSQANTVAGTVKRTKNESCMIMREEDGRRLAMGGRKGNINNQLVQVQVGG